VQSPIQILQADQKVTSLIDIDTERWKQDFIYRVFTEAEAQVICNIPLTPLQPQDKLIRRCTTNGHYTVRSAYYMEREDQASQSGECSHPHSSSPTWHLIWNLPISNAMKMFLWRACNNILLTKENLLQRREVSDNLCPICTLAVETTAHILWHCPSAQDMRCSGPFRFQKSTLVSLNFKCLFEEMIDGFEYEKLALWAIIARTI
jgi:hypothetical protein